MPIVPMVLVLCNMLIFLIDTQVLLHAELSATANLSEWDGRKGYRVCLTLPKLGIITT